MGDGWGEGCFAGSCCCPKACKTSRRKSRARGRLCRKLKALADRLFLLNCQGCEAIVDEAAREGKCPFPPSQPAHGCISLRAQSLRLLCQLAQFLPSTSPSEQCRGPEGEESILKQSKRWYWLAAKALLHQWSNWRTLQAVCTHGPCATDERLHHSNWLAALLLQCPECFTFAAEFGFKSSLTAQSLCCYPSKESQVQRVCVPAFPSVALK